ncbi:hypothetical protein BBK82_00165 [Lentzea guizhouensis]|uniref:Amine oxidase domain-containing protein n=1 Tax=Lentzea guizhouensis TaxID=1586287 RepID=A0A1B2HAI7_9PSEU|nr:hypothetical protein BBK82_00165 [Lentzea guizhouensis]
MLEARDRVGGRTFAAPWQGETIEVGGAYVGDVHTRVVAELQRYGIGTVPANPLPQRTFFPALGGGQQEVDFLTTILEFDGMLAKLFQGWQDFFPSPRDPLAARDVVAQYDPLSLRDGLARADLSDRDRLWVGGMAAGYSGGSAADGGLTAWAQAWVAGENQYVSIQEHRIAGGTSALVGAILADARADVRLGSPVVSVVEEPGRVVVTTLTGARYHAPAVVVAVPVNVWRTIHFAPGLPTPFRAAAREGAGVFNAHKLHIRIRGDLKAPFALGREGAPMWLIVPQHEFPDGDQLIVAVCVDPHANLDNQAEVQERVRSILPGATVRDYQYHSWSRDRWARGGWALRRPGQLLRQVPALHQPHGRVVFASGDVSAAWHGYMEGAIESGAIAAAQAVSLS